MIRYAAFASFLVALLTFLGCGANSQNQPPQPPQPSGNTAGGTANNSGAQPPLVGGWADASTGDEAVVAAAEFAAREQSKNGKPITVQSIKSAKQQVVAGMNYQVELSVDEAGQPRNAEAIVYQDLQQTHSLTSWTWK